MGVLQRLGLYATLPASPGDVAQVADLPPAVAAAFGINVESETVTRRQAKTIPSMRRGEQVITGTISGFPLTAHRITSGQNNRTAPTLPDRAPVRRALLEQPDPYITASEWKRRVIEDLIYSPWAWLRKVGTDPEGFPRYLQHLDQTKLTLDFERQGLWFGGEWIPGAELVRIDSPGQGVLIDGAVVLKTALLLEAAVRRFADLDVPIGVLSDASNATPTGRGRMTDEEVDALLNRWSDPKRRRSTRWIGRLKYDRIQLDAAAIQLAQARERSDVAIAQLLNLESEQVNAPGTSSMTYNNRASVAAARLGSCAPYMRALTERLSWADITPQGQSVQFDVVGFTRGTDAEAITAAAAAVAAGLITVDEGRSRWLDMPPITSGVTP